MWKKTGGRKSRWTVPLTLIIVGTGKCKKMSKNLKYFEIFSVPLLRENLGACKKIYILRPLQILPSWYFMNALPPALDSIIGILHRQKFTVTKV